MTHDLPYEIDLDNLTIEIYYHINFCTKGLAPWISDDMVDPLAECIRKIIEGIDGQLIAANGGEDHEHILGEFSPEYSADDCVRRIKEGSATWIRETYPALSDFAWQEGYCAVTTSSCYLESLGTYIANQRDFHKNESYEKELKDHLLMHNIDFREEDLFD